MAYSNSKINQHKNKNLILCLTSSTLKLIIKINSLIKINGAIFIILSLVFIDTLSAETSSGKVIHISDGDTITIINQNQQRLIVRLAFIDAPEYDQKFGKQAKQHLRKLIYNKIIKINIHTVDDYNRLVGTVFFQKQNINAAMLEAGLAWHYKFYAKSQSKSEKNKYNNLEKTAQRQKKGLWAAPNPTPPWNWRRKSTAQKPSKKI